MPLVFSYGTLQEEEVQKSTFGRLLQGDKDLLPGFEDSIVRIEDSRKAAAAGRTHYANIIPATKRTAASAAQYSKLLMRNCRQPMNTRWTPATREYSSHSRRAKRPGSISPTHPVRGDRSSAFSRKLEEIDRQNDGGMVRTYAGS
jgi:hypothetical protein